jgi:MFS family permease
MALDSSKAVHQYGLVTASYWGFTLTDGALRMLVLLFFHDLGFSPMEIASLFILYELSGVFTSLIGGWIASRIGLIATLQLGLVLQILAIAMLLRENQQLTVFYVMCAQALSGVGKDLNKLSAKSSIKALLPDQAHSPLYKWVSLLTGSKNALKGIGFFLGGALLSGIGFRYTLMSMIALLAVILVVGLFLFSAIHYSESKPRFRELLSKSSAINRLSLGSIIFVWLPGCLVRYRSSCLSSRASCIGATCKWEALWLSGLLVMALFKQSPRKITNSSRSKHHASTIDGNVLAKWGMLLAVVPLIMALALTFFQDQGLAVVLCLGTIRICLCY